MAKFSFISGLCENGLHEGESPKSASGQPLMVCTSWAKDSWGAMCKCECHVRITNMFAEANLPRIPMQNPAYRVENKYVMPSAEERIKLHAEARQQKIKQESLPLSVKKLAMFDDTPSGKRARGQLEDEVLLVCSQFSRGELPVETLTTAIIASLIDEANPPSVGAIGAVFDRWEKIGFAHCPKKPVRFESFTMEGMQHGLQYMKERFKDEARRSRIMPASNIIARRNGRNDRH